MSQSLTCSHNWYPYSRIAYGLLSQSLPYYLMAHEREFCNGYFWVHRNGQYRGHQMSAVDGCVSKNVNNAVPSKVKEAVSKIGEPFDCSHGKLRSV